MPWYGTFQSIQFDLVESHRTTKSCAWQRENIPRMKVDQIRSRRTLISFKLDEEPGLKLSKTIFFLLKIFLTVSTFFNECKKNLFIRPNSQNLKLKVFKTFSKASSLIFYHNSEVLNNQAA